MKPDHETQADETPDRVEAKKPYATPELTIHGTVEQLTKNQGAKNNDALIGSQIL